jgi:hypothetical protein
VSEGGRGLHRRGIGPTTSIGLTNLANAAGCGAAATRRQPNRASLQVAAARATEQEGVSPLLAPWPVLANFEKRGLCRAQHNEDWTKRPTRDRELEPQAVVLRVPSWKYVVVACSLFPLAKELTHDEARGRRPVSRQCRVPQASRDPDHLLRRRPTLSETVRLTLPAIDSARVVARVEQGKGQKDRYVMLKQRTAAVIIAEIGDDIVGVPQRATLGELGGTLSQHQRERRKAKATRGCARRPSPRRALGAIGHRRGAWPPATAGSCTIVDTRKQPMLIARSVALSLA